MLKKSKFTQGEINFSLLGLLSMYSNSGKLPFVELIKATYNQDAPSRKSYKNILENVRFPYIENMIAKLAKKQEMRFSTQNLYHKF